MTASFLRVLEKKTFFSINFLRIETVSVLFFGGVLDKGPCRGFFRRMDVAGGLALGPITFLSIWGWISMTWKD